MHDFILNGTIMKMKQTSRVLLIVIDPTNDRQALTQKIRFLSMDIFLNEDTILKITQKLMLQHHLSAENLKNDLLARAKNIYKTLV